MAPNVGVGLVLVPNVLSNKQQKGLMVRSVVPGGAAERLGLFKSGDILIAIDRYDCSKASMNDAKARILGQAGTEVLLTVLRDGETRKFSVRRASARPASASASVPSPQQQASAQNHVGQGLQSEQASNNRSRVVSRQASRQVSRAGSRAGSRASSPPRAATSNLDNSLALSRSSLQPPSADSLYATNMTMSGPDPNVCGVGITLRPDRAGTLAVKSMTPGGPADKNGQVSIGDSLLRVDDVSVIGMDIHSIRPLIVGASGSVVSLSFRKIGSATTYSVDLTRAITRAPSRGVGSMSQAGSRAPSAPPSAPVSPRASTKSAPPREIGIGAVLVADQRHGTFLIKRVNLEGPAHRSGLLQAGDHVHEVEGVSLKGMSMDDVKKMVVGPEGTSVSLKITRGSHTGTRTSIRIRRITNSQDGMPSARAGTAPPAPRPSSSRDDNSSSKYSNRSAVDRKSSQSVPVSRMGSIDAGSRSKSASIDQGRSSRQGSSGVGMVLQRTSQGLVVKSLVGGSSAERAKVVRIGDVLTSIEGRPIGGKSINDVRPMLTGPTGSSVALGLMRGGRHLGVSLVRGSASAASSGRPSSSSMLRHSSDGLSRTNFRDRDGRGSSSSRQSQEQTIYSTGSRALNNSRLTPVREPASPHDQGRASPTSPGALHRMLHENSSTSSMPPMSLDGGRGPVAGRAARTRHMM